MTQLSRRVLMKKGIVMLWPILVLVCVIMHLWILKQKCVILRWQIFMKEDMNMPRPILVLICVIMHS